MLALEVIENYEKFLGLRKEWCDLLERCSYRTPLYSFDWQRIWWDAFGRAYRPLIVLIRNLNKLVGVAPMMFSRERKGPFSVRKLGFMHNDHSFRSDFVFAEQPENCLRLILEFCFSHRNIWDIIEFNRMAEDSGNVSHLRALLRAQGIPCVIKTSHYSPYARSDSDFMGYMKTRTRKFRRTISNARNRLRNAGESEFVVVRLPSQSLAEHLEQLYRITLKSWKGSIGTAIGSQEVLKKFYKGIAESWHTKKGLELRFLKVNGLHISSLFSLIEDGRLYTLKTAYDTEYRKISPGNLIFYSLLEEHMNAGIQEIDFLGVKQFYLDRWCTGYRRHFHVSIFNKTNPYSRFIYHLKKNLKPILRAFKFKGKSIVNTTENIRVDQCLSQSTK